MGYKNNEAGMYLYIYMVSWSYTMYIQQMASTRPILAAPRTNLGN